MKKLTTVTLGLSFIASSLLAGVSANIELDPIIDEIVPGKRIVVNAAIEDKAGIEVARTYFKSVDAANYSFVPMNCEASACSATLPAVSEGTKSIDYLVLVKNGENVVYKTQTFNAETLPADASTPSYQTEPTGDVIKVKTELAKAPKMVQGFSDNIAMDTVDSSLRFGAVAGITSSGGAAGGGAAAASTATGATAGGTVAATSAAALSTTAIVGTTVAVAGGAAAASSGGSSSSSSDSDTHTTTTEEPTTTTAATCSDLSGSYTGSSYYTDGQPECSQLEVVINQTECSITDTSYYYCSDTGESNTLTGSVSDTTATFDTTIGLADGTISGTTISGTWKEYDTSGTYSVSK